MPILSESERLMNHLIKQGFSDLVCDCAEMIVVKLPVGEERETTNQGDKTYEQSL